MVAVLDRGVAAGFAVLVRVVVMMIHLLAPWNYGLMCRIGISFRLGGMSQRVLDEIDDVPIGQCIEEMRSLPAADDQPFAAQQAQAL